MTTVFSWIAFNLFVLGMLVLDLTVFHRKSRVVHPREAILWSAFWILLALLFCCGILFFQGDDSALSFLTGYVLEKSLSVDNLFLFMVIFAYFQVPDAYLHKVLFWGVLGALVMRIIFIFSGVLLFQKFDWIAYVFGAFLVFTGIKLAFFKEQKIHPERNLILRLFRCWMPITSDYVGDRFFVFRQGCYWATPLFVALLFIETMDLLFALDSVPAILAITQDPFIVYTSNVFAILGLRSLYFALAGSLKSLEYLNEGLALVLIFIGIKMLLAHVFVISTLASLAVIVVILGVAVLASVLRTSS